MKWFLNNLNINRKLDTYNITGLNFTNETKNFL